MIKKLGGKVPKNEMEEEEQEAKVVESEIKIVEKIVEVEKPKPQTRECGVQTDVMEEPTSVAVPAAVPVEPVIEVQTKIVERVVEKIINPEADKIDDTEIPCDENGRYIIFDKISTPENPTGDILSADFEARNMNRKIQILLASLK